MNSTTEKRWFLVQCKPKQDFRALENLQRQGYGCLLPLHKVERLQKGQWQALEEPLFPGYLFIELDTLLDNWMPIRSTRGVSQIVRFGETPLPVPGTIIDYLRTRNPPLEHELRPGDKVIVNWAGTSGVEAVYLAKDGTQRVILLLHLLQREVKVSTSAKNLIIAS